MNLAILDTDADGWTVLAALRNKRGVWCLFDALNKRFMGPVSSTAVRESVLEYRAASEGDWVYYTSIA